MDVLNRITELKERRGWTDYELAERCGLTQSTISAWYRKNYDPTISSLEKVCKAFDMTLSQFFATNDDSVDLTPEQRNMLENWNALSKKQKESILTLMENMPSQA